MQIWEIVVDVLLYGLYAVLLVLAIAVIVKMVFEIKCSTEECYMRNTFNTTNLTEPGKYVLYEFGGITIEEKITFFSATGDGAISFNTVDGRDVIVMTDKWQEIVVPERTEYYEE